MEAANSRWRSNADSLAEFLSKANPKNWPKATLKTELHRHLGLTAQEAVLRLRKDWAADARNFDAIYDQSLAMADMLSDGIAKQFPAGPKK